MGARAAIRAAGHPAVSAVAGLAPWLPLGQPAAQLAGRRVLLAHGTADTITSPAETWAFVKRAREFTAVTAIEVRDGDHPMLRRARLWHSIAAEFARSAVGLTAESAEPRHPADPANPAGQADPAGAGGDVAAAVTSRPATSLASSSEPDPPPSGRPLRAICPSAVTCSKLLKASSSSLRVLYNGAMATCPVCPNTQGVRQW